MGIQTRGCCPSLGACGKDHAYCAKEGAGISQMGESFCDQRSSSSRNRGGREFKSERRSFTSPSQGGLVLSDPKRYENSGRVGVPFCGSIEREAQRPLARGKQKK